MWDGCKSIIDDDPSLVIFKFTLGTASWIGVVQEGNLLLVKAVSIDHRGLDDVLGNTTRLEIFRISKVDELVVEATVW